MSGLGTTRILIDFVRQQHEGSTINQRASTDKIESNFHWSKLREAAAIHIPTDLHLRCLDLHKFGQIFVHKWQRFERRWQRLIGLVRLYSWKARVARKTKNLENYSSAATQILESRKILEEPYQVEILKPSKVIVILKYS